MNFYHTFLITSCSVAFMFTLYCTWETGRGYRILKRRRDLLWRMMMMILFRLSVAGAGFIAALLAFILLLFSEQEAVELSGAIAIVRMILFAGILIYLSLPSAIGALLAINIDHQEDNRHGTS